MFVGSGLSRMWEVGFWDNVDELLSGSVGMGRVGESGAVLVDEV